MMWILVVCYIVFFNRNFSTASLHVFYSNDRCQSLGDKCQQDTDCCSYLTCYFLEDKNLCLPSDILMKRNAEDFIVPPYYKSKAYFYRHGIHIPQLPFYEAHKEQPIKTHERNKMEWNHCQFHEDCGEGNCCYVHFRFRSLPKSFCRPNRNNDDNDLCEPLTKYRSLKDVSAWKKYQREKSTNKQHPILSPLTTKIFQ